MRNYSITLAVLGMLIGVLALSATAFAKARPPEPEAPPAVVLTELPPEEAGTPERTADPLAFLLKDQRLRLLRRLAELVRPLLGQALPASAARETEPPAGLFRAALRVEDPEMGRLFLADPDGNPIEKIITDKDGDAALGPMAPGRYSVTMGRAVLGSFRLLDNAALSEADGLLRTDGELLYLSPLSSPATGLPLEPLQPLLPADLN